MGSYGLQRQETNLKTVFAQSLVPVGLARNNVLHVELDNSHELSSTDDQEYLSRILRLETHIQLIFSLVSRNSDALLHMSEDMFTSFVSMA